MTESENGRRNSSQQDLPVEKTRFKMYLVKSMLGKKEQVSQEYL
jgi:hypothetical protein